MFQNVLRATGPRSYPYRLADSMIGWMMPGRANFEASWRESCERACMPYCGLVRREARLTPGAAHSSAVSPSATHHSLSTPSTVFQWRGSVAFSFCDFAIRRGRRSSVATSADPPSHTCWRPSQYVEACRNRRAHLISPIVPCSYALGE